MTSIPTDPAADEAPRPRRRVARTVPGEPAVTPGPLRDAVAGGKTSHPADPSSPLLPGEIQMSSSLPSVAEAETRRPDPGTAEADPAAARRLPASAGRGRTPQTPAGRAEPSSALPAGSSGAEWRKKVKAATSALHAAQRRGAHRYTRIADRSAGSQYKPGMAVRKPEKRDGAT